MTKLFEEIIPVLETSDKQAAIALIDDSLWIIAKCDAIVDHLIKNEMSEFTTSTAVSTAIYVRYLKRVAAHLRNITSGIVNPFERIGFRMEDDE